MENMYQDLIEDVSSQISQRLLGEQGWLDEHRLLLDEKVFQLMLLIGLSALKQIFVHLAHQKIEECKKAGMSIHKREDIGINTRMGHVDGVPSPALRDRKTAEIVRPMKQTFGLRGQGKTLALERALSDFGSENSYAGAERILEAHYGFNIGRTSILRVTQTVGSDALDYFDDRLAHTAEVYGAPRALRTKSVDELLVELDGCLIRTGKLMTARQAGLTLEDGHQPDDVVRLEKWREVRTGFVRGFNEVEPLYVCQRGDYETICDQLFAMGVERGLTPETLVVGCGDGGHGLCEGLEMAFSNFSYILDYTHLKKHFYETAEALGIEEKMRPRWVESFTDKLWEKNVADWDAQLEEILERLRTLHGKCANQRLENLIDYLVKFAEAIEYSRFESRGWPTGSGEVESAHKHVPQARLKLPGACWRVENLNPMLAMRVIKKNGWWNDFWQWRENQKLSA